jgi:hypothetical protein
MIATVYVRLKLAAERVGSSGKTVPSAAKAGAVFNHLRTG